jgi:hemerythrin superfamily protein
LTNDSPTSAVEVLKRDHDEVEKLFDQYEDAKDESNAELKAQIVAAVCKALTIHAQIEEEIFYPAMRRGEDDAQDLVDEAAVEHQTVKALVAELEGASPDDDLYDAKVKVLSEYVKHHVKEEEGEMFPLARKSDLDLEALGTELLARKEALAAEPEGAAAAPARRRPSRNGTHKSGTARTRTATKSTARKTAAPGGRH